MITFSDTKNKTINPRNILGGIPGLFEDDFEKETSAISTITQGVSGVFEAITSLGQDITGLESKNEVPKPYYDAFKGEPEDKLDPAKFPSTGSIEFNKNQAAELQEKKRKEADRKKTFYQNLKDEQLRAQMAKDRMWLEEEINDIASNISTEEKNELLHYQASYKDKSIYQKAELRKKLIEKRREAQKQQKAASVPSPAKQPSALEGAFEGRSGNQGSGTANLSAHATG